MPPTLTAAARRWGWAALTVLVACWLSPWWALAWFAESARWAALPWWVPPA